MITDYYRPQTIDEALILLSKPGHKAMGGGTWLNQFRLETYSVVDLQSLGLKQLEKTGNNLEIGACVTLQELYESPNCPASLKAAINLEAGLNIRNVATCAGMLVTADGRSPFATAILSLDTRINFLDKGTVNSTGISDFLALRPDNILILSITIPVNCETSFETIGRSPMDRPIVCAALTRWSSGRTRLALGGYKSHPLLAMDGTEADGLEAAAKNAFHEAGDEWASSEYRSSAAAALAARCLEKLV